MSVPSKSICREGWLVEPVCQRQSAYAVHKSEMSEKKNGGCFLWLFAVGVS